MKYKYNCIYNEILCKMIKNMVRQLEETYVKRIMTSYCFDIIFQNYGEIQILLCALHSLRTKVNILSPTLKFQIQYLFQFFAYLSSKCPSTKPVMLKHKVKYRNKHSKPTTNY